VIAYTWANGGSRRQKKNIIMLFRFIRGTLLYLLLIASVFYGDADNLSDGQALFATIGIPVLLLVHRIILNWQVKRQMFGYASGQKSDGDKDPEVAEKVALHRPEIVEFSGMTIPEEIVGFREALIEKVSWKLRRSWQISALACLAYAIVPPVLALLFGNKFTAAWGTYLVLVGFYFVLVTMRRNIGLKDLRPENARYDVSVRDFHPVTIIAKALRVIVTPRADVLLALAWSASLVSMSHPSAVPTDGDAGSIIHSTAFFVGTVVVMICYLAASLWRYTIPNANPNISLLVLRVFGPAKAARFTFDRVVSCWNRFGLHFTVDDPSLAHFRNRFFQVRTLYEFLVLYLMSIFFWQAGIGGLLVIAAFDWIDMARRWPVKNYEQVLQRFSKTLPVPGWHIQECRDGLPHGYLADGRGPVREIRQCHPDGPARLQRGARWQCLRGQLPVRSLPGGQHRFSARRRHGPGTDLPDDVRQLA
jgi:hypothetical protein